MRKMSLLFIFITSVSAWAQSPADSLERVIKTLPNDTVRVAARLRLAEQYWRDANDSLALQVAQRVQLDAEKLNYPRGTAEALMHQGIVYYRRGDYTRALHAFEEAISLFPDVRDESLQALIFHWNGNAHYGLDHYELALSNYLKALKIREALQDKRGTSFTLYNIANIYADQHDYDKAFDFHLRSLKIKEEIGDRRGVAFSYNNLANIYKSKSQYNLALEYYINALTIFNELKYDRGTAYALGNIGEVYERQELFTDALEALTRAVEKLTPLNDNQALAEAYNHLASVNLKIGKYSEAEKNLQRAEQHAIQAGVKNELIENYLIAAKLDSARGNMRGAFEWFKRFHVAKEEVFNAEKSRQMAAMQASFDSESKDHAITLLNKEKEYELRTRKNQASIFVAVMVSLVALAFVLFQFLRDKQRINKKLYQQKQYAEELNQLNEKLFSIISHDLRSPLKSLQGLLELAETTHLTEEELRRLLSSIGNNANHVNGLLDNLLHWAKGRLNGNKISPEPIDLKKLVEANVHLLEPVAKEKGIVLRNDLQDGLLAQADRHMIDLVIRNLISNAIKFTSSNGAIVVRGSHEEGQAVVYVEDNGMGIPEPQRAKLFSNQNFSTPGTANERGTGLGLILCREFLEKNGGSIWAKSTYMHGSTFCFSLPLSERTASVAERREPVLQSV